MDSTRLYNVIDEIISDYEEFGVLENLAKLEETFERYTYPYNEEGITEINLSIEELFSSLDNCYSNGFGIVKSKIAQHIGANILIGNDFKNLIRSAVSAPLGSLGDESQNLTSAIEKITIAFNKIKLARSSLDAIGVEGSKLTEFSEISVMLPDEYTNREMNSFNGNIKQWTHITRTFQEILTGNVEPPKLSGVSDGCLELYILCVPVVAKGLSSALSQLLDVYERVLKIRKLRLELSELSAPATEIETITTHEKELISSQIDEIKAFIFSNSVQQTDERMNELNSMLQYAISLMATMIDNGIGIDIDSPGDNDPVSEEDDGENSDVKPDTLGINDKITRETRLKLKRLQSFENQNVFKHLPSPDDNVDDDDGDGDGDGDGD